MGEVAGICLAGDRHHHWAVECEVLSMVASLGDATLGWGLTMVVVVSVGIEDDRGGGS